MMVVRLVPSKRVSLLGIILSAAVGPSSLRTMVSFELLVCKSATLFFLFVCFFSWWGHTQPPTWRTRCWFFSVLYREPCLAPSPGRYSPQSHRGTQTSPPHHGSNTLRRNPDQHIPEFTSICHTCAKCIFWQKISAPDVLHEGALVMWFYYQIPVLGLSQLFLRLITTYRMCCSTCATGQIADSSWWSTGERIQPSKEHLFSNILKTSLVTVICCLSRPSLFTDDVKKIYKKTPKNMVISFF